AAGRPRDAQAEAQRAVELDTQSFDANLQLAYLAFQQGKIDRGIEILEGVRTVIAQMPVRRTDPATGDLNLAPLDCQKKGAGRAVDYAAESLDLWQRPAGWYYKALILFNADRWGESLPVYQETMRRLPPEYPQIHLSIAVVYEGLQRFQEAREEYLNYLALA